MPWTKGILLFTMAVMALSSSLRADNGVVSEDTIRVGKLLIGDEAKLHPAEAKLQQLGTTVHCGSDSMTLRVPGSRTPHFLVDRGEGSPVPLSEMPESCGFSLKRVRRDISLVAPYRGCHVRKQSGSYILPLIIMGAPVKMACPVSHRLPTVSCLPSAMIVSLGVRADEVFVKVAGSWQPLLLTYSQCSFMLDAVADSLVVTAPFTGSCWEMKDTERHLPLLYGNREVTLSCPVTPTVPPLVPTVPAHDPAGMPPVVYPFPFGQPGWYPYPNVASPTMPPTTTTTTTTAPLPPPQYPMQQLYSMYPMKGYPPFLYYGGAPTVPPTTTTTTTTPPPPPPPQNPMQQQLYSMYPMKGYPPFLYYGGAPTVPPTTTTTTPPPPPPPQNPMQQQLYSMYPMKGYPPFLYYGGAPTVPPTTTTPPPPPPQNPMQQQLYSMYPMKGFPPLLYSGGAPTVPPTTTTTTPPPPPPQDPILQQMFQYMYPMQGFPPQFYGAPTTPPPPPQDPIPQQMFPLMYPMKGFDHFYRGAQPHRRWFSGFSPYMYGFQSPDALTTPAPATMTPPAAQDVPYGGYSSTFYGLQPVKSFAPPNVQYPFMPQHRHHLGFGPRSRKSVSS